MLRTSILCSRIQRPVISQPTHPEMSSMLMLTREHNARQWKDPSALAFLLGIYCLKVHNANTYELTLLSGYDVTSEMVKST